MSRTSLSYRIDRWEHRHEQRATTVLLLGWMAALCVFAAGCLTSSPTLTLRLLPIAVAMAFVGAPAAALATLLISAALGDKVFPELAPLPPRLPDPAPELTTAERDRDWLLLENDRLREENDRLRSERGYR